MRSVIEIVSGKITEFRKDFGKIGFWAVFAMVMPMIGLSVFVGAIYEISPWLEANPVFGAPLFVLTISVLSGLAILPTNIVGITSGWAFGFPLGLVTMLAAIGGAVALNFFVSQRLAKGKFDKMIREKPRLNAIHKALLAGNLWKVFLIIVLLRLSPATPFAATNFVISASGVSMKSFILGTVVGYLPRTSATVFVGSTLHQLSFKHPTDFWLLVVGIVATVIATIAVGVLSKRALNRLTLEHKDSSLAR
ncbi:MAG: VTT domain-containing protein [Pyrinomonadaceae bacterium]